MAETETEERVAGRAAGWSGTAGGIADRTALTIRRAPTVDNERHQLQLKTS